MTISLITAFDNNQLIGQHQSLPWHLPEDLAYFKKVTTNQTIVMGRKTYESIGRPLPNRKNIVISHSLPAKEGVTIIHEPERLLDYPEPLFIIGGSHIYEYFLPYASYLYITHIEHTFEGDTFFPAINWSAYQCISEVISKPNPSRSFSLRFCVYQRGAGEKLFSN